MDYICKECGEEFEYSYTAQKFCTGRLLCVCRYDDKSSRIVLGAKRNRDGSKLSFMAYTLMKCITQSDFDILPSSTASAVTTPVQSEKTVSEAPRPVPVIKLDAPLADDIEEYDEDDKPGRTDNSAIGKNTAKRLLDGLKKPSKIRNPFLDDIHDD